MVESDKQIITKDYRGEAIACVKGNVLQMHKQIYAEYNGDFDRIYTEAYNNASYMGKVIKPGKVYELSYLECSCPKVKSGLRSNPEQCERCVSRAQNKLVCSAEMEQRHRM